MLTTCSGAAATVCCKWRHRYRSFFPSAAEVQQRKSNKAEQLHIPMLAAKSALLAH